MGLAWSIVSARPTDDKRCSLPGVSPYPSETPPDSAEIIIAKHRNGPLDSVQLRFLKEYAKFVDGEPSLSDYHCYSGDSSEPRTITRGSKMNDIEEEGPF